MRDHLVWMFALLLLFGTGWIAGCPAADDDDDDDDDTSGDMDMEGLVYFLDLGAGDFSYSAPNGAEALIPTLYPTDTGNIFTASSIDEAAGTVQIMVGSGSLVDGEANPPVWEQGTLPTSTLSGTYADLSFEAGPADMVFDFEMGASHLWDVVVGGTYAPDGSELVDVHLEAMADLAPYDLYMGFEIGGLCEGLEESIGAECVDCPADGPNQGPYCLFLSAEGGTCPLLHGLTMAPVN